LARPLVRSGPAAGPVWSGRSPGLARTLARSGLARLDAADPVPIRTLVADPGGVWAEPQVAGLSGLVAVPIRTLLVHLGW
jgi:hypothetical protein